MRLARTIIVSIFGMLCLLQAWHAIADTKTGTMTVKATIASACSFSTKALDFGDYDISDISGIPVWNYPARTQYAAGQLEIKCVVGTAPTISMDNGKNYSGSTRRMTDGKGHYIEYEIHRPGSNTEDAACSEWSMLPWNTTSTLTIVPSADATKSRRYNVCGRATRGQVVPNGIYLDTVVVTLTF